MCVNTPAPHIQTLSVLVVSSTPLASPWHQPHTLRDGGFREGSICRENSRVPDLRSCLSRSGGGRLLVGAAPRSPPSVEEGYVHKGSEPGPVNVGTQTVVPLALV